MLQKRKGKLRYIVVGLFKALGILGPCFISLNLEKFLGCGTIDQLIEPVGMRFPKILSGLNNLPSLRIYGDAKISIGMV